MITTRLNLILHETINNKKESSVRIERFITIGTISLGPYLLSVLRNSGVSAFQGLLTYVIYVDTFGTACNVRIKVDVRISGVSARRGSTVFAIAFSARLNGLQVDQVDRENDK